MRECVRARARVCVCVYGGVGFSTRTHECKAGDGWVVSQSCGCHVVVRTPTLNLQARCPLLYDRLLQVHTTPQVAFHLTQMLLIPQPPNIE